MKKKVVCVGEGRATYKNLTGLMLTVTDSKLDSLLLITKTLHERNPDVVGKICPKNIFCAFKHVNFHEYCASTHIEVLTKYEDFGRRVFFHGTSKSLNKVLQNKGNARSKLFVISDELAIKEIDCQGVHHAGPGIVDFVASEVLPQSDPQLSVVVCDKVLKAPLIKGRIDGLPLEFISWRILVKQIAERLISNGEHVGYHSCRETLKVLRNIFPRVSTKYRAVFVRLEKLEEEQNIVEVRLYDKMDCEDFDPKKYPPVEKTVDQRWQAKVTKRETNLKVLVVDPRITAHKSYLQRHVAESRSEALKKARKLSDKTGNFASIFLLGSLSDWTDIIKFALKKGKLSTLEITKARYIVEVPEQKSFRVISLYRDGESKIEHLRSVEFAFIRDCGALHLTHAVPLY